MKTCDVCGREHEGFDQTCDPCTFPVLVATRPPPGGDVVYLMEASMVEPSERIQEVNFIEWNKWTAERDRYGSLHDFLGFGGQTQAGYEFGRRLTNCLPVGYWQGIIIGMLETLRKRSRYPGSMVTHDRYQELIKLFCEINSIDESSKPKDKANHA